MTDPEWQFMGMRDLGWRILRRIRVADKWHTKVMGTGGAT